MEHYFIAKQHKESDYFTFTENFNGKDFTFKSVDSVFSKNKIDEGVKQVYKNRENHEEIADIILVIIEGLIVKTVLGNKTQEEIEDIKKMLSRL